MSDQANGEIGPVDGTATHFHPVIPVAPLDPEDQFDPSALFDEVDDTDLNAKVKAAWTDFGKALAAALPTLGPGTQLELTLDPSASGADEAFYGVSVEAVEGGQLHAYAVGNNSLPPAHRLDRTAVAGLVALGWSPPRVVKNDDDRFGLHLPVSDAYLMAGIITRTLRDVYRAPHPAFLVYIAFAAEDAPVEQPVLGAARSQSGADEDITLDGEIDLADLPLAEKVATVVATMMKTTPESLPMDNDGDIGIRSGSAMVFVRVRDNPPLVDVFSPVLTDVEPNEQLHVRLSELTHRMPIGRLYCTGDTVWASVPVFGRDFQATHLMLAVQVMTGLADELDDRLHGEFGGKRFFVEGDRVPAETPPTAATPAPNTGFYL